MDANENARYWDENAEAWTRLARAGYDEFRDYVNTPAFLEMLPDVRDLRGLDIGCGEGHNTRLVRGRGAKMFAFDISKVFLGHAVAEEKRSPAGVRYLAASAIDLPFHPASFDFAMATMSLMDIPNHERVVAEAHRVLRPGGFLQFSITHPCFQTPRWKYVHDDDGKTVAVECGDYFAPPADEIEQWTFASIPPHIQKETREFRIPVFRRTLSSWLNLLIGAGFTLEAFCEPFADEETAERHPALAVTRAFAFFLIIRCRKQPEARK